MSSSQHLTHVCRAKRLSSMRRVVLAYLASSLLLAGCVSLPGGAPSSPSKPWPVPNMASYSAAVRASETQATVEVSDTKAYELAELIDIAQRTNPETRIAGNARQAAIRTGMVESTYYPMLAVQAARIPASGIDDSKKRGSARVLQSGCGGDHSNGDAEVADVRLRRTRSVSDLILLAFVLKPRQELDAYRPVGEAVLEVSKCCWANRVVGTRIATCFPSIAATKAARIATSVLPKPTSPQISRSVGCSALRSPSTALMAAALFRAFPRRESPGRSSGRRPHRCRRHARCGRCASHTPREARPPRL